MKFNEKLVLNSYLLSLFGVSSLEELSGSFKEDTRNEKVDEEGVSLFYYNLASKLHSTTQLDKYKLLEYDNNIVRHTKKLKQDIKWKYFQYLSLLFTEIYLDRYCSSNETLLQDLNLYLEGFNKELTQKGVLKKEKISPFELENLNKLAFWNATGSGKTLLMHINMMQFNHYNRNQINKTMLITPNAGLSQQHLKEFETSGIEAEMFTEESKGLFEQELIEVLEISKLKALKGETTFAVESFGDDNLVFIDEGHRGSSGEEWKTNRDALSKNGFAFEYSATFGQAIGASTAKKRNELTQEYAKSILFDYSYKHFKNDGFGKDYTILNLKDEPVDEVKYNYLVGSLLSFYQQKKIYNDHPQKLKVYNIENPLMIFVGGKVTKTLSKDEGSDITNVLKFLEKFVNDKSITQESIAKVLEYQSGITTASGVDIFTGKFDYLSTLNMSSEAIYNDILKSIFNSNGGLLHLEELKGNEGEIGLRVGESDYFGVINIGDIPKFMKLCITLKFNTLSKDFNKSLFLTINEPNSNINMLIGSRKFTEGWSSWRVSTMGLLNMGKSEGSQVIQLFGRGVRLKGKEMSLKRSTHYGKELESIYLNAERLNIFGLKANYMEEFKKYLENEGVESGEMFEMRLPVLKDKRYQDKDLKVLRVTQTWHEVKHLEYNTNRAISKNVWVNLYAKAQVLGVMAKSDYTMKPKLYQFESKELVFLDRERLFLELIAYKNEKRYFNLTLSQESIEDFIVHHDWYRLEAPKNYFSIKKFEDFQKVQETFTALLKKYIDAFYKYHKNDWEKDYMEYQALKESDANFVDEYKIAFEKEGNSDLIERLKSLKEALGSNDLSYQIGLGYFKSFNSSKHLYNPLLFKNGSLKSIKISPIELNMGEIQFVEDLEAYLDNNYSDTEIFLLRNKSKVGVGFFEDGGFYPDFIMWILKENKQYITFIDPKGIRNLNPKTDPKINFYKSIKSKEEKMKDENMVLNACIISNTPFSEVEDLHSDMTKIELENKNVLFQEDMNYVAKMFKNILE